MLLARSVVVFEEDLFLTFLFKAIENLQRCGDVFFDILVTIKQENFGSQYVFKHFETLIGV